MLHSHILLIGEGLREFFWVCNFSQMGFFGSMKEMGIFFESWKKHRDFFGHYTFISSNVCARLAQLVRSPTASQKVPDSSPGLVEG